MCKRRMVRPVNSSDLFQRAAVKQRETFVNAAHKLARSFRCRLACFRTESGDLLRHLARFREPGRPRIDQRAERFRVVGLPGQGRVIEFEPLASPLAPRLLQDPEADNIFQKPCRTAVAGFVGKVMFADFFADERLRQLQAEERPSPGRKVGPILFPFRAGTAATAAPVSCEQVATTCNSLKPVSEATSGNNGPSTVPGGTSCGKILGGKPHRSISTCDQERVRGL